MLRIVFVFLFVKNAVVYGFPPGTLFQRIAGSNGFDDFENILPQNDIFPEFHYPHTDFEEVFSLVKKPTVENNSRSGQESEEINVKENSSIPLSDRTDKFNSTLLQAILKNTTENNETVDYENDTSDNATEIIRLLREELNGTNLFNNSLPKADADKLPRQEFNDTDDPEFASEEKQSQEEGSSEEENMLTGLISAFIGGLSRPDGSVDVEAIVGLLGSLSTQNPDGSYDFQGLTDLLKGFFGGGDGDGGSDVGAFVGGLLGAVIKGVANPPGAKGVGIFTGKVLGGILPALFGPPDDQQPVDMYGKPIVDVGGFLKSLIKTIGASSGLGPQDNGTGKLNLIQTVFAAVKSIFAASSKKGDR